MAQDVGALVLIANGGLVNPRIVCGTTARDGALSAHRLCAPVSLVPMLVQVPVGGSTSRRMVLTKVIDFGF